MEFDLIQTARLRLFDLLSTAKLESVIQTFHESYKWLVGSLINYRIVQLVLILFRSETRLQLSKKALSQFGSQSLIILSNTNPIPAAPSRTPIEFCQPSWGRNFW